METTVIRNETSEYQNNKLLSNLVMGAKTDGNNIDFYIKNPFNKIEGSAELTDENKERLMQIFNQPTCNDSLLTRLENELTPIYEKDKNKKDKNKKDKNKKDKKDKSDKSDKKDKKDKSDKSDKSDKKDKKDKSEKDKGKSYKEKDLDKKDKDKKINLKISKKKLKKEERMKKLSRRKK